MSDAAAEKPARTPRRRAGRASGPADGVEQTLDAAVAETAQVPGPDAASDDDAAAAAPAKKPARRRSTRATAAPAADAAPVTDAAPSGATAVDAQSGETPVDAEKPTKSRATAKGARTAKATSTPPAEAATVAAEVPAVDDPAPGAKAPAATATEPAPARRARRAASRPAGAPSPVAPETDAVAIPSALTAADDAPASPAAAPAENETPSAPRSRSRRSTRPAAAASQAEQPEATTEAEAAPRGEAPAAPARSRSTRSRATKAPVEPAEVEEAPVEEAPATRLPMTALLFQAPDASKAPRRRRAQAPADAPAPVADETPADDETEEIEVLDDVVPESETEGAETEGAETEAVDVDDASDDTAEGESEETSEESSEEGVAPRRRRRRGGRGRRRSSSGTSGEAGQSGDADNSAETEAPSDDDAPGPDDETAESTDDEEHAAGSSSRRRRRRRRSGDPDGEPRQRRASSGSSTASDEVTALKGSTRLEAKRQRRREGRDAGRRRQIITEAEFLARREAVERSMVVREKDGRTQIAVLEDGVLVEHYVSQAEQASMVGNVYLGRVQNVLPSMEAAFIDVGKGRNAVLYAGEVNWDAAGLEGQPRRIEQALKSGDPVLVQVTKDPIGHKGARLTSQITLAGRYLVYVPGGGMTGISRKLPDTERARLKKLLRELVPDTAGVIVRTAAEGASEEELRADIARLQGQWEKIEKKAKSGNAPVLLQGEPDMAIRVVRDIFNDDFSTLVVQGTSAWDAISTYVGELAPDLAERVTRWTDEKDVFASHRIDEQLAKGMDRKVWLPSGGSLVIDRTEAMTVVDVNTGKFTGSGGTLEETVTRNNLEAAEEIVRQLRLRDIGGIIVIDFIDMVLESNRDLVLRRLVECLGRDRTKHQVAEVTSLGLVQMTRKRVGQGLVEAFSTTCEHCHGRGFIVHADPVEKGNGGGNGGQQASEPSQGESKRSRRKRGGSAKEEPAPASAPAVPVLPAARAEVSATLAAIAAAAAQAHVDDPAAATTSADTTHGAVEQAVAEEVAVDAPVPASSVAAADEATEAATPVAAEGQAPAAAEEVAAEEIVLDLPEPVAKSRTTRARGSRRVTASGRAADRGTQTAEPEAPAADTSGEEGRPRLDVLAELAQVRREDLH